MPFVQVDIHPRKRKNIIHVLNVERLRIQKKLGDRLICRPDVNKAGRGGEEDYKSCPFFHTESLTLVTSLISRTS